MIVALMATATEFSSFPDAWATYNVTEIEWLQADNYDRGYEHLSDAEIVAEAINQPTFDVVSPDDETEAVANESRLLFLSFITYGHAVKCLTAA